jgi:hypothetical protein
MILEMLHIMIRSQMIMIRGSRQLDIGNAQVLDPQTGISIIIEDSASMAESRVVKTKNNILKAHGGGTADC